MLCFSLNDTFVEKKFRRQNVSNINIITNSIAKNEIFLVLLYFETNVFFLQSDITVLLMVFKRIIFGISFKFFNKKTFMSSKLLNM